MSIAFPNLSMTIIDEINTLKDLIKEVSEENKKIKEEILDLKKENNELKIKLNVLQNLFNKFYKEYKDGDLQLDKLINAKKYFDKAKLKDFFG